MQNYLPPQVKQTDIVDNAQKIVNILDLSFEDLGHVVAKIGHKNFRTKQIWQFIYNRGVKHIDELANIPKDLKTSLADEFDIARPKVAVKQVSKDGTIKWLLSFSDGQKAETVFIPESDRGTLCVSSQVGCTLTCKFCHTGTQKLKRNLTSAEIIGQIMLAKDELDDWPSSKTGRTISNIVLMGMGEPLFNYDNVKKAVQTMLKDDGLCFSNRRITLSTSGVVPQIEPCAHDLGVNLAISLHAVNDKVRSEIMPINKKYPIATLLDACKKYSQIVRGKKITFEYVMLKDINDSDEDAYNLVKILNQMPSKVNIIPFNKWPGSKYECSSPDRIKQFAKIIHEAGFPSPVRTPRGEDILAACGQLKSES